MRGFVRTPKGLLLIVLLALTAIAAPVEGSAALGRVLSSVLAAAAIDSLLFAWRGRRLQFPVSAILTGLISGMVLSSGAPIYVPVTAAAAAVLSKHVIRTSRGHLFNPAAAGLVVTSLLFASPQSWWGSLSNLPAIFALLTLLLGMLVAGKVNKLPSIFAFAGLYFALFSAVALMGKAAAVSDVFRQPFTGAAFFFASFMLTDPPTSPARPSDQVLFGGAVALASFLVYSLTSGAVYYLPLALLAGNALEAIRRGAASNSHEGVMQLLADESHPSHERGLPVAVSCTWSGDNEADDCKASGALR
ncbi:MAG: RnfABCDGE type electron transport complex subunit D [Chloroflexota bacterium]|nr:RnfABCDGE type electron transport complex subunit D [Chloroflexota bacterium]